MENHSKRAADNLRILIAAMVEKAKSGHPGGAMGGADFIHILFSEFLNFDPDDGEWKYRDRFFLDPGHMSPMLYSALALCHRFTIADLEAFRQWDSPTSGHPELCVKRGIENTSGPLGQGHTFAVGAAIAAKALYARTGAEDFKQEKIYAYISDGGIQEEISQGAGRLAGHLGLDNLIMFYDSNDIQLSTPTSSVTSEDTVLKYKAWNWNVLEIDGNNHEQIREALNKALQEKNRPTLIVGHTVMGLGARKEDGSSYEKTCKTHGAPLGKGNFEATVSNLGGDPSNPFVIWDDVQAVYDKRLAELRNIVAERKRQHAAWASENPVAEKNIENWFAGILPNIPWNEIIVKENCATREASKEVLSILAQHVPNMIVSSADLCNSDKTDGFLKYSADISRTNFAGGFLQCGVSELTMACACIGMMLHGGLIAAMGTFFVFSDYMKPALRMAALMQVPVKFVWTHDSFRVGEDGPTHEPVEQEAQARLMEQLKNHSGQDSVRVLRPADSQETIASWKIALENNATPTALIFSRQNVQDLPKSDAEANVRRGAYIVKDAQDYDIILLANGSEAGTLFLLSEELESKGIRSRLVSCPSEGLFRQQSEAYQNAVLPSDKKVFALTAGLPVTLQGLAGRNSRIIGLNHFGYSAPYKILDEKFGFTLENLTREVLDFLAQ
ncbi:MAG: transketolase [Alloprevotella sp.]|nr:transketolase [Alloprevotella sp.]